MVGIETLNVQEMVYFTEFLNLFLNVFSFFFKKDVFSIDFFYESKVVAIECHVIR